MQITELYLQDDDKIMLDDFTLVPHKDLFKLNKAELLPYERVDNIWMSITIEMDTGLMTYSRVVYTLFDLLSDIGGLSGILISFFLMIVTAWNHNKFDNMLVSRLFKIKRRDKGADEAETISNSCMPNCTDWILSFFPDCCICCKRARREVAMQKARDKLAGETNIIEIVRAWRYMEIALRQLIPANELGLLKEKA